MNPSDKLALENPPIERRSMHDYQTERETLFTDDGQRMFLAIRDRVATCLREAGAVRAAEAWKGISGNTHMMLACMDRMVELGELREVNAGPQTWAQHRVFVSTKGGV